MLIQGGEAAALVTTPKEKKKSSPLAGGVGLERSRGKN